MRSVDVSIVTKNIKEMCIQANHFLSEDMDIAMKNAVETEEAPLGKQILTQLQENLKIAGEDMIPICQDTGMAVVFIEVGQEVHFEGGSLTDAIDEGVRQGYVEGYLRKSVVGDPLIRENTKDNTPAVLHTKIVPGDKVRITLAPKGFGSENMSQIRMFKPSAGLQGIKDFILEVVETAGPNPCPPMVVGVGIGGTFDKCALLAKKALMRPLGSHNENERAASMEKLLEDGINAIGLGPQGMGGKYSVMGVNIENTARHPSTIGVAVNVGCWSHRRGHIVVNPDLTVTCDTHSTWKFNA